MALPTLSSRFKNNHIEKQLQRMHEREERFRTNWDQAAKYYTNNTLKASRQSSWSSDHNFRKSMDAYSSRDEKSKKAEQLHQRRMKLTKLLNDERNVLEAELKGLSVGNNERLREMKDKVEDLKSAREEKRKNLAQEKLYELWAANNPDLRKVDSEIHTAHVKSAWGEQLEDKKEVQKRDAETERQFHNEYEKARVVAMENLQKKEEERRKREIERSEILKQQMKDLTERESEAKALRLEEDKIQREQIKLENLQAQRKKMEEMRKHGELQRFLHHQYKAQMRRRAQQIQQELEFDRQILARLAEEEQERQKMESARQEQAKQDVAWMQKVLEDQLKLEKEREAEFDLLYREEARQMWNKRELEWKKESEARRRLMCEVLDERNLQLQAQMESNRRDQENLLLEREKLVREMEEVEKTSRIEKEVEEQRKKERREELAGELTTRREKKQREEAMAEREMADEQAAEKEYDELIKMEAERRRHIGYRDVRKPRRAAWEE